MIPEQAKVMAHYNKWMNGKVYRVCESLADEELNRDRGAFFKSIHGTLNHILLGDKVWFGRFTGVPFKAQSLDQILHTDFAELRAEREALDDKVCAWAGALTGETLNAEFRWVSMLNPQPRSCPLWVAVAHFFNHQTHHRGQITTLLTQSNIDVGATDLLVLPGLVAMDGA
jgi:uncharacterized damage-inducible protein DinB